MTPERCCWRADDGENAVVALDDGYAVATPLGVDRIPAWRARLFLAAQSLFRILMTIRPA